MVGRVGTLAELELLVTRYLIRSRVLLSLALDVVVGANVRAAGESD